MKGFLKIITLVFTVIVVLYGSFRMVKTLFIKPYLIDQEQIVVNNTRQNLFMFGTEETNPVILFVHGGPGLPESPLFLKYNRDLLENFTVVFWEQRGSGYSKVSDTTEISDSVLVSDLCEISRYLMERFSREKVALLCHSWGTILGVRAVETSPELFSAYIGVSQKSSLHEAESLIFQKTLELVATDNNEELLRELQGIGDSSGVSYDFTDKEKRMAVRKASIEYGGGIWGETGYGTYLPTYLFSYEYGSIPGMWRLINGLVVSVESLLDDMNRADLTAEVMSLEVPFYIIQGKHDLQTPYEESRRLSDRIEAPAKEFFTFENSAHNPLYEEPEKANRIIEEIISSVE